MKFSFALLFYIGAASMTFGQSPGGIGTANLTSWFKPDNLSVGNLSNWTTTFPSGGSAITLTDGSAPFPVATKTPPNATSNYNMTVDFSGNSTSNLKALENGTALNLLDNNGASDQGSFFASYYLPANFSCGGCHVVNYIESGSAPRDGIQFRAKLGSNGRLAIGSGNSPNASRDFLQEFNRDIISYVGNKSGTGTMTAYKKSKVFTGGGPSSTTGFPGLYFGVRKASSSGYNAPFDGFINEVITFNKSLNPLEASKVHTYLAIKYGSTLANSGGGAQGDYIATDGTIVWDASSSNNYHNNVIGIAREDTEDLLQKQSHSFDDSIRIYMNTLALSNDANTASASDFGNDLSYVILGDNQGAMCATTSSALELPPTCGLFSRLEREWKITKTQFSGNLNIDVLLNACANTGSVAAADLYLLIDDDGDFSNGGTSCYTNGDGSGVVISYSGTTISISNINDGHLPNNTTRFFTIGSILPITPLPVELGFFDVTCIENGKLIEWRTISENDNDFFTIESSTDGFHFDKLIEINGAGNSTNEQHYAWIDTTRSSQIRYYRLTQTDFSGESAVFPIKASLCETGSSISVYPNPFQSILGLDADYSGQLELFDITGSIIIRDQINKGINSYHFENLQSGTYFIRAILTNGSVEIIKLIKN